ncbi:MAG: hypothetical protein Q8882_08115, partial [Bacillota bacterium]|nr:hypothetical protein [Bacillota bacterium]
STPYIADTLECDIKETAYYSASELNGMRRKASDALSLARTVRREKEPRKDYNYYILKEPVTENPFYISASVTTKEQYKALYDAGLSRIYAPLSFAEEVGAYAGILDAVFDENKILSASRIIAGSLGAYSYSKKAGKLTSADYSMNIFNSVSALALDFEFVTLSPELSLRQCMDISSYAKTEAIAYGYLPLMKIGNCIVNAAGECKQKRCAGCDKEIKLKDRKGAIFKIKSDGKMNILYNSVPIFMADKLNEIKSAGIGGVRLSFTFESPVECAKIYLMFKENKKIEFPKSFTRGHFYRGF